MFPLQTTVLIVDDSPVSCETTQNYLNEIGYKNTLLAGDGDEALSLIHQLIASDKAVDLVICDWNMPKMTGIDLLRAIRAIPKLATLPFILLTSMNQIQDVTSAVIAGVDTFIVKPVEKETLEKKLQEVYDKRMKKKK